MDHAKTFESLKRSQVSPENPQPASECQITRRANHCGCVAAPVQSFRAKFFPFAVGQINPKDSPVPALQRGALRDRHETLGLDAVDAGRRTTNGWLAYGEAAWS
jgi:hypothetical protein